jgi:hypothetical protein
VSIALAAAPRSTGSAAVLDMRLCPRGSTLRDDRAAPLVDEAGRPDKIIKF